MATSEPGATFRTIEETPGSAPVGVGTATTNARTATRPDRDDTGSDTMPDMEKDQT